jgi:hypothetical protein
MSDKPVPFEIVSTDTGMRVACNGSLRLTLPETDGRLFRRRGIKGLATKAAGETLLPLLNQFAGELVAQPDMPPGAVVARLMALAGTVHATEPEQVEWAVAELDGVRVYVGGMDIVVTRQDLQP